MVETIKDFDEKKWRTLSGICMKHPSLVERFAAYKIFRHNSGKRSLWIFIERDERDEWWHNDDA